MKKVIDSVWCLVAEILTVASISRLVFAERALSLKLWDYWCLCVRSVHVYDECWSLGNHSIEQILRLMYWTKAAAHVHCEHITNCLFLVFMVCVVCCVWNIYSQVHKYWDIDTILTFLALYTTTMDFKWNKMCFNCRLSALIWGYLHPNQVNGVGITTVCICASHFVLWKQMY